MSNNILTTESVVGKVGGQIVAIIQSCCCIRDEEERKNLQETNGRSALPRVSRSVMLIANLVDTSLSQVFISTHLHNHKTAQAEDSHHIIIVLFEHLHLILK